MALTRTFTELGGSTSVASDLQTGRAIGTAAADRWVVLNFTCNSAAPGSVTIGGVAATSITDATLGAAIGWAWALVPTGTTADIVVNGSGDWSVQGIWAVYGAASIVETAHVWDLDFANSTFDINVAAGGVTFATAIDASGAVAALTWTAGLTDDGATRLTATIYGRSGGANNASASLLTCSYSGSALPAAWAISFQPASSVTHYTMPAATGTVALAGQAADLYGPWKLVGVGAVVESVATGHTLTLPAGVQQGDLLIAVISSRIASTTSITLPSGGEWTLVSEQKANNILTTTSAVASGMMAYCIRGASNPNLTFTHPTAPSVALGRIIAYRGVDPASPKDTQNAVTTAINTTAVSVAGVTTAGTGELLVVAACGGQEAAWSAFDATNPTVASGATNTTQHPTYGTWLERADSSTTTGADTSLAIADAIKSAAGATGNITATASLGASHVIIVGAFKRVPVSGAPYSLVASTGTITLAGQAAGLKFGHKTAAGLGTLTAAGQVAGLKVGRKAAAGLGTIAISGQLVTLRRTRTMSANHGTVVLSGQTAVLTKSTAVINYSMSAEPGVVTLAGQVVALNRNRVMVAGHGVIAVSGRTAAVRHARILSSVTGTVSISGQSTVLRQSHVLAAGLGTLRPSGTQVTLSYKRKMAVTPGTVVMAAFGVGLVYSTASSMMASLGTLTLHGQTATLRYARKFSITHGTLNFGGQSATLKYARKFSITHGTLTLGGQAAALRKTRKTAATTGTLVIGGQAATLRYVRKIKMPAGHGTLAFVGPTVNLIHSSSGAKVLPAGIGFINISGQPIALRSVRKTVAAPGIIAIGGQAAALRVSRKMLSATGTLVIGGQPATLRHSYRMTAGTGTLALSGQAADLIYHSAKILRAETGFLVIRGRPAALRYESSVIAPPRPPEPSDTCTTTTVTGVSATAVAVKKETRFLPALAEAIAKWFPELGGRALAVSEVTVTKENIPTLPLAMVAFARGTGDQSGKSSQTTFNMEDAFVVEFWLEPSRYKKASGADTPFWSYYNYETIRDKLLEHLARYETPGGERITYRGLNIEADPLAVTLTFAFVANMRWCPSKSYLPDQIIKSVGFKLCPAPGCCPDACIEEELEDAC